MDNLPPDLREFIELLNSHRVRYLIVGGYAVAYHGYPRLTGDIDFFVDVSEENALKLEKVLHAFGFGSLGIQAADFIQPGVIIQLGYPPNRIDLITALSGVEFSSAWEKRIEDALDGTPTYIIDKQSLLSNKQATGRPKDRIDFDRLS